MTRPRLLAPENDYRSILDVDPGEPDERVTVVIPVYNRVDLLRRTLAGLRAQRFPGGRFDVVVGDDGSEEDVPAAVEEARAAGLDVRTVRRERSGYGAGQARNLAAAYTDAPVLVFLDADCLPHPDLVAAHAAWHRRSPDLVVIGARHPLDTDALSVDEIVAQAWDVPKVGGLPPSDWRATFYRRTAQLRSGDEAFRALVSSNFSVRRAHFERVGGFDETFRRWGGEDTELGWRLWQAGLYVVAADDAATFHQTQDEGGEPGWRERARRDNDGVVTTKIPHRFYRRSVEGDLYEVPKVSWVVTPPVPSRARALWEQLKRHRFSDWELLLHDPEEELTAFGELHAGDPRVRVVPGDALDVLRASRGEIVLLVDGWVTPDARLAARLVRRLDSRPRTSIVTVGIAAGPNGSQRYTHRAEAERLAASWGRHLPLAVATRRREWAKVIDEAVALEDAWEQIRDLGRAAHLPGPLASVPAERRPSVSEPAPAEITFTADGTALLDDVRRRPIAQAPKLAARYVVQRLRQEPYRAPTAEPPVADAGRPAAGSGAERQTPVGVRYVGWTGHDNLGDEAMLVAARQLMPWGEVATSGDPTDLLLLGGGTLINRRIYLDWLRDKDSPRSERAVLGTGVGSPDYWGLSERPEDWVEFLGTCAYVGVRGPSSYATLRDWGYQGPMEISGDLALVLEAPDRTPPVADGRLVVSPLDTGGELWGGTDGDVLDELAEVVARAVAEGRETWLLACFPGDDRVCIEVMRRAGHPDLPYLAGYRDLDESLRLLGSASVVVAERLHAAVLAAAVDTPFVGLEYRPKVRDFAASVEQEHRVLRTDETDAARVLDAVADIERDRAGSVETIGAHVTTYRSRLVAATDRLGELLR